MTTLREKEIIDLVVKGLSSKEIGARLFITEKTVKFHLTKIYKIEDVKSRTGLIVKYLHGNATKADGPVSGVDYVRGEG